MVTCVKVWVDWEAIIYSTSHFSRIHWTKIPIPKWPVTFPFPFLSNLRFIHNNHNNPFSNLWWLIAAAPTSSSLWLAPNPSKRWGELFFLLYTPFWLTLCLGIVIPFNLYEVLLYPPFTFFFVKHSNYDLQSFDHIWAHYGNKSRLDLNHT